jgi:hypothetical protein
VLPRYHGSAGDPIVEYRNSHRILFVKKMPEVSRDKDTLRLNNNIRSLAEKKSTLTHFMDILLQNATIQSIGKGIIGSAAEENSRKHANWKEGSSYFLPLSSLACGWVNKSKIAEEKKSSTDNNDDNDNDVKNSSSGDDDNVILYTMKVSPSDLKDMQKEDESQQLSPWVMKAIKLFGSIGDNNESSDEILLSSEQSAKVSEIIELVLNEK